MRFDDPTNDRAEREVELFLVHAGALGDATAEPGNVPDRGEGREPPLDLAVRELTRLRVSDGQHAHIYVMRARQGVEPFGVAAGFRQLPGAETRRDLAGRERVTVGRAP